MLTFHLHRIAVAGGNQNGIHIQKGEKYRELYILLLLCYQKSKRINRITEQQIENLGQS